MLFATQKAPKSTRSVLSRKGHRRKAEKFFSILFVPNKKYVKVFKGFNWVCALGLCEFVVWVR